MVTRVAAALSSLALGACSVVGIRSGTEEPAYSVVATLPADGAKVEIRRYAERIAAETTLATGQEAARYTGFRRLAGYIFGDNHSRTKIAMTAPVAVEKQTIAMTAPVAQAPAPGGGWTIRFFMPKGSTLEKLPEPNNPEVHLVTVPPETVAVLRFTGSYSPDTVAERQRALLKALADSAWAPQGEPVVWFYDPPWTLPFLRRNEAAVSVVPKVTQP
jgi:hypothetical protein